MHSKGALTGLVLMGGRSLRMGRDKAEIPWPEAPLWERQVRVLWALCDPVWRAVAYGHREEPGVLVDKTPYPGPVPPILAGLQQMPGNWLLVLAVDLVQVDVELLEKLVQTRVEGGVSMAADEQHWQPLCSIWHRSVLAKIPTDRDWAGCSMRSLLQHVPTTEYPVPKYAAHQLKNLNTPQDLGEVTL